MKSTVKKKTLMKDMTQGSPVKLILEFTLPMIFGFLFQQFYNMADTVIVGRFLGVKALAAVGATGSVNFCVIGFCMGICNGFAIPVAQKFGAKDERGLRKSAGNGATLSVIFAAVMTGITVVLCRQILELMNTPSDIIVRRLPVYCCDICGHSGYSFYIICSPATSAHLEMRGRRSFSLPCPPCLNILLDALFIVVFKMGVAGAALCNGSIPGGFGDTVSLRDDGQHFPILRLQKEDWKLNRTDVGPLCRMGIRYGPQYSITAIGSVVLQVAVILLGSTAVASVTAASKIQMLLGGPFDAMGSTMATLRRTECRGQASGPDQQGMKGCLIIGVVYLQRHWELLFCGESRLHGCLSIKGKARYLGQVYGYRRASAVCYMLLAAVNIVRFPTGYGIQYVCHTRRSV